MELTVLSNSYLKDYTAIDIEDLHDPDAPSMITLEMKDRQRYFQGTLSDGHVNGNTDKAVCYIAFA